MSSNHTLVDCDKWEEMIKYISDTDAYVIRDVREVDKINALIRENLREAAAVHEACEKTIRESRETLKKACSANLDKLGHQMQESLSKNAEVFETQLDSLRNDVKKTSVRTDDLNRAIDAVAANYDAIFKQTLASEKSADSRARAVLAELDRMIERMQELEPARFLPTEYNTLAALRESVRVNLNAGDSQAAITVSQDGILKSAKLLVELQLLNEQYNERYLEVSKQAAKIREKIEYLYSKEGVLKVDTADGEMEIDYDISRWSFGGFDRLAETFAKKEELLKNGNLTLKNLEGLARSFDILENAIEECDASARKERAGALAVSDMVVRLYQGMLDSGWEVTDSGYDDEDERKSYKLTFGGENGNEIAFVVAPERAEQPSILMEAFSDSEVHTERIKNSVQAVLENAGVEIVSSEQRDDCHENPKVNTFIENALNETRMNIEQRRVSASEQLLNNIN